MLATSPYSSTLVVSFLLVSSLELRLRSAKVGSSSRARRLLVRRIFLESGEGALQIIFLLFLAGVSCCISSCAAAGWGGLLSLPPSNVLKMALLVDHWGVSLIESSERPRLPRLLLGRDAAATAQAHC